MPAQMYVMAAIGTVAAVIFFKEFVYEPHIAPNVERWAEQFIAHRQTRRRQRAAPAPAQARSQNAPRNRSRRSDSDGGDSGLPSRSGIELENLVAREVDEWISNVNRSQKTLKHRKHPLAGGLDNPTASIQYAPVSPTHVLFDPSSPITPTSGHSSPGALIDAHTSSSTLRSPAAPVVRLATPDLSLRPLSPGVLNDASIIASYEVAVASDSSRSNLDLESLADSPFSSRPQSPFAAVRAPSYQGVIFEAPLSELDFLSDSDGSSESFVVHSASNASVGGSINGDDFDAISASSWASAITRSV